MTLSSDTLVAPVPSAADPLDQFIPLEQEAAELEPTSGTNIIAGTSPNVPQSVSPSTTQANSVASATFQTGSPDASVADNTTQTRSTTLIWNTPTGQLAPTETTTAQSSPISTQVLMPQSAV